jgi:hypothetical protein
LAGCALGFLLFWSAKTGQELPFWPAMAVVAVNIAVAGKLFLDVRKAKQLRQQTTQAPKTKERKR